MERAILTGIIEPNAVEWFVEYDWMEFVELARTAGAIEAVVSTLAIHHAFIPPTIHHTTPDPECDLDYVDEGPRDADIRVVLSNSFAFGGNNTSLVIGKYSEKGVGHE